MQPKTDQPRDSDHTTSGQRRRPRQLSRFLTSVRCFAELIRIYWIIARNAPVYAKISTGLLVKAIPRFACPKIALRPFVRVQSHAPREWFKAEYGGVPPPTSLNSRLITHEQDSLPCRAAIRCKLNESRECSVKFCWHEIVFNTASCRYASMLGSQSVNRVCIFTICFPALGVPADTLFSPPSGILHTTCSQI